MANLLGHQIFLPAIKVNAGTKTDLTIIVSSKTPKATAKPSSARNTSGKTPKTANVAASTTPAEVITPPVTVKAFRVPALVPIFNDSSLTLVIKKML